MTRQSAGLFASVRALLGRLSHPRAVVGAGSLSVCIAPNVRSVSMTIHAYRETTIARRIEAVFDYVGDSRNEPDSLSGDELLVSDEPTGYALLLGAGG